MSWCKKNCMGVFLLPAAMFFSNGFKTRSHFQSRLGTVCCGPKDNFIQFMSKMILLQADEDVLMPPDTENAEREHLCLQVGLLSFSF